MNSHAPLAGIRVIEVGNFMAVPFCGMQLADLGADVVKIENPRGGDLTRATGPFIEGESSNFIRLNRNKRSVALDLKSPAGKAAFRKLVATADVLIENLRPGTMHGLGLDYETLRGDMPRLVYLAATGFGSSGPYTELPGLDIIAQGMSGLMSITGEPHGAPVKVGVPIADLTCGLYGALAVVAALRARDRDGTGQFIDVSLLESAVSLAVWEAGRYFATGEVPLRAGSAHQSIAPYQAVRSADGYFTLGANSHAHWVRACTALGLGELVDDARFATNEARMINRPALIAAIEAVTLTQPAAHWTARLSAAGIPCGPILTFDRVFAEEHLAQRDFFADAPHTTLGPVRQLGCAMHFSQTPVTLERAGPLLGEHTCTVLREAGFEENDIAALLQDGAAVSA